MESIKILIPDDESEPLVFTSMLAVRKWMDKNNYHFHVYEYQGKTITSEREIADKENEIVYTISNSFSYNAKDVEGGYI